MKTVVNFTTVNTRIHFIQFLLNYGVIYNQLARSHIIKIDSSELSSYYLGWVLFMSEYKHINIISDNADTLLFDSNMYKQIDNSSNTQELASNQTSSIKLNISITTHQHSLSIKLSTIGNVTLKQHKFNIKLSRVYPDFFNRQDSLFYLTLPLGSDKQIFNDYLINTQNNVYHYYNFKYLFAKWTYL
jgi:hypothetical protein